MFNSRLNRGLLILFLLVFIFSAVVTYHVSRNLLDEDASAELLLAKCMFDERSVLPKDWFFGNEYRVDIQLILSPLFYFFSDWGMVRFAGVMIIQLLLVVSLAFMLWQAGLELSGVFFGSVLIIIPWCVAYGRIILYHCYYTPYLIFSFLTLGLVFRFRRTHSKITFMLLAVICIISCLNGIRQFYAFLIPFLGIGFWCLLRNKDKNLFLLSILCCAFGILGVIINKTVITGNIHFGDVNKTEFGFNGLSSLFLTVFAILRQFSYRSNVDRAGFWGIMSLAGIMVAAYSALSSAEGLIFEKKRNVQVLKGFLIVQLLQNVVVFLFYIPPHSSRYDYSRYLLTASVWVIPLFCCLFVERQQRFRKIIYSFILAVFIGNGLLNSFFFLDPNHFTQDYDGISYTSTNVVQDYAGAIRFLQEHDYALGYAVYDANVLIEKMNGLPVVWLNKTAEGLSYRNLLTRRSFREIVSDNAFFIGNYVDTASFLAELDEEDAYRVYSDENIFIYRLTDQEKFKNHLDAQTR